MSIESLLTVAGAELEVAWFGAPAGDDPVIVLLHDGLGSVSTWRDFPKRLAEASGLAVFAYSRVGYGRSSVAALPRAVEFMHDEAQRLPEVCAAAGIRRTILVGHSDGASIALLAAGAAQHPSLRIEGLALMAPHVLVEDRTVSSIEALQEAFTLGLVRQKLAAHHADVDHTFGGWSRIWLAQQFRSWNIESCLPGVGVPVLLVQGERDEFGTERQLDAIERGVPATVERVSIPACGHSPHRDAPDATLRAILPFLRKLEGC